MTITSGRRRSVLSHWFCRINYGCDFMKVKKMVPETPPVGRSSKDQSEYSQMSLTFSLLPYRLASLVRTKPARALLLLFLLLYPPAVHFHLHPLPDGP